MKPHQPLDLAWLEREALRYLARQESTQRRVEQALERAVRRHGERSGEDVESAIGLIPEVVKRLAERDYVDDRRFGAQLIARLQRQGRSVAQIRAQLFAKGVPETLALELTPDPEREDEIEAAFRLARRRRIGPFCRDADARRRERDRHLAILGRQGFSRDTAEAVIDSEAPLETP